MKKIFFLLLCLNASFAFAQLPGFVNVRQDTTLVYQRGAYRNDPMRAQWEVKVVRKDSVYVVELYDKKNVLQEQISYADKDLEERKGPYFFYVNGLLKTEGFYDKGYKTGLWVTYGTDKKAVKKVNYKFGKLHGLYLSFWENGQQKSAGTYFHNVKVDAWQMFYADGKPALKETYSDKGQLVDSAYLAKDGKSINKSLIVQPASYPGGEANFYKALGKSFKYPRMVPKGITGNIVVDCLVQEDGSLSDIKVISSPDVMLAAYVVKIIREMPNWLPATELGEPVPQRIKITVPIPL